MVKLQSKVILVISLIVGISSLVFSQSGYDLWLRYDEIRDQTKRKTALSILENVQFSDSSKTADIIRNELQLAGSGMLGIQPKFTSFSGKGKGIPTRVMQQ